MAITFIPNDPEAVESLPARSVTPRPNRPRNRAKVDVQGAVPEGKYPVDTADFLYWQAREGVLRAIDAWERATGETVSRWAASIGTTLRVFPDEGDDLNAYYEPGVGLRFFHHVSAGTVTRTGSSADVVAHETGHAILDAMRPGLGAVNYPEVAAFHEAFGDCVAIITGLADATTRRKVLAGPSGLGGANALEAWGEHLGEGVRVALGASHPAAGPRHALNAFQWQLPSTLPSAGGHDTMINESHSFARIFVGCFYNTIRNIVGSDAVTSAQLWRATKTATRLLATAVPNATEGARFFQAIGRGMVLADRVQNAGANATAIQKAFEGHNVLLGSNALLAPRAALAGPPPTATPRRAALAAETALDLAARIGAGVGSLTTELVLLGRQHVVKAVHERVVPLDDLDPRLAGVVAWAPEPVLVGESGRRAAALSAMPDAQATNDEVHAFVRSLLQSQRVDFGAPARPGPRTAAALDHGEAPVGLATHVVSTRDNQLVLARIRFACRACAAR